MTYQQRTKTDCGPACVSSVTGEDYGRVCDLWGWRNHGDIRDDLLDSPWHHFAALTKLRQPWAIVTCGDIIRGVAKPEKTVILLHGLQNPYLQQHWCILASASPVAVCVHWGDGTVKHFSRESFERAYAGGSPACAYEVGRGKIGLTWYQRLYVAITGKFI